MPLDRDVIDAVHAMDEHDLRRLHRIHAGADDLDVHLIMDNYATHKAPKIKAWFAKRPRFHGRWGRRH